MQNKFIQFLGIAKRSGNVCEGYNKTEEFIKLKKLSLVIMSKESSDNTKKKFKVYCERFKVPIIENYSKTDTQYLTEFSQSLGVDMHIVETSFDATGDTRKSPCFLCSWNRRKALFETAKSLGCNKIALGHHQDDVLVTLLMNMTFQGAFSTMPPALKMDKFDMTIIRPLCRIEERDITRLAELHAYRKQEKNCPHEHTSNRSRMAQVLATLEQLNPEARFNLWGSMTNIQTDLLPPKV